jgi:hypothetical protein
LHDGLEVVIHNPHQIVSRMAEIMASTKPKPFVVVSPPFMFLMLKMRVKLGYPLIHRGKW